VSGQAITASLSGHKRLLSGQPAQLASATRLRRLGRRQMANGPYHIGVSETVPGNATSSAATGNNLASTAKGHTSSIEERYY
jgi:NaMN:DMB phosphoribosyltransferase